MAFFNSAVNALQTLVIALGAGLAVWGVINLLEGYGSDNPAAKSQGIKQLMSGDESPLSLKADFLLSLCELIVGGKDGLQPIERTVIDRCVRLVYRDIALGLNTEKIPTLQDLYEILCAQPEPEAKRIATALELYCTGSLNLFNHQTNVNLNSRVVCFVLKGMAVYRRKR